MGFTGSVPKAPAPRHASVATSMVMRWRSLVAGTVSVLEATRRQLSASSPSAAIIAPRRIWQRYADDLLAASVAAEALKLETMGATACK